MRKLRGGVRAELEALVRREKTKKFSSRDKEISDRAGRVKKEEEKIKFKT